MHVRTRNHEHEQAQAVSDPLPGHRAVQFSWVQSPSPCAPVMAQLVSQLDWNIDLVWWSFLGYRMLAFFASASTIPLTDFIYRVESMEPGGTRREHNLKTKNKKLPVNSIGDSRAFHAVQVDPNPVGLDSACRGD